MKRLALPNATDSKVTLKRYYGKTLGNDRWYFRTPFHFIGNMGLDWGPSMKPNFEAAANMPEPANDAFVTIHHDFKSALMVAV